MKKKYEKPVIVKQVSGIMNKFARQSVLTEELMDIDGVKIADIVEQFGSPVMVFSESTIRKNYQEAYQSFSVRYPKIQFGWSYKTNYLSAICSIYHQEGSWAEVVSLYEYEKAKRLGVSGNNIIINGPMKEEKLIEMAIKDGAILNIDHYDELFEIERIAKKLDTTVDVGIRLNMDTGIYPVWTRFGFNLENGQAFQAINRIKNGGILNLIGLHIHQGTFILEPEAYRTAAFKMLDFTKLIKEKLEIEIKFIDLGGGFASLNTLHEQYLPGEQASPSMSQFAEAITDGFLSYPYNDIEQPTLILETGRALIDDAGYCISTVIGTKRLPDGHKALLIDAGVNILFTSFWYKHEIVPAQPFDGFIEDTVVYGPLCMNIDVIRASIKLPDMKKGERVVIKPVGAYNVTQWMQFITYRPAVVLISEKGEMELIREAEDLEYVMEKEILPERLKKF